MAQRNETDGGTAFAGPLVILDEDTEVVASFEGPEDLVKRIDTLVTALPGGTAQTTAVGTVPAGSVILGVVATVVDPFDGTTDTLEVGITGNTDKYIDPVDLDTDGVAGTTIFSATGTNNDQKVLEYATAAIPVIATWTNTGGTVTAGSVRVQVIYI